MLTPRRASLLVLLLFTSVAGSAWAQDLAAADALFKQGIADMDAGRYDTACPAFVESNRLDPRPGTLFAIAECEARAGRIATAVTRYDDYVQAVSRQTVAIRLRHAERVKIAKAQVQALQPNIPTLTLSLPSDAPEGTAVQRDGMDLAGPSLGIALPIDPGEHVVSVRLPSGQAAEQRFVLSNGEKKILELTVPSVASAPAAPAARQAAARKAPAATRAASSAARRADPPPPEDSGSGRRVAAFVTGGVGVAGIAAGAVTGALVLGKKSVIDENCVGARCNAEGKQAADSGKTLGLMSTIGFGVGLAGLATGVVLLVTAPSETKVGAAKPGMRAGLLDAGPMGAALGVKGVW